jgi:hypothetical protein
MGGSLQRLPRHLPRQQLAEVQVLAVLVVVRDAAVVTAAEQAAAAAVAVHNSHQAMQQGA